MLAINTNKQRGFTPVVLAVITAVATLLLLFGIVVMAYGFNVAKSGGCTAAQVLHYATAGQNTKAKTLKEICDLLGGGKQANGSGGTLSRVPIGRHTLSGELIDLSTLDIKTDPILPASEAKIDKNCSAAAIEIYTTLQNKYGESVSVSGSYSLDENRLPIKGHAKGYALDFSGGTLSLSNANEAVSVIEETKWASSVSNEFVDSSKEKAIGGHIHVTLNCSPALIARSSDCSALTTADIKKIRGLNRKPQNEWLEWIRQAADVHLGGDQAALIALIHQESRFVVDATPKDKDGNTVSSAVGLGQFIESTAKAQPEFNGESEDFGGKKWTNGYIDNKDPRLDPQRSIFAAASYLRQSYGKTKGRGCFANSRKDAALGCAYLFGYHTCSDPSSKSCRLGQKGRDNIEDLYNSLFASGACVSTGDDFEHGEEDSDSTEDEVIAVQKSYSGRLVSFESVMSNYDIGNQNLVFDENFGNALLAAIKDAEKNGLKIRIVSGYRPQSKSSNHGSGRAVDINAYKNGKVVCMQKIADNKKNGASSTGKCSQEVLNMMAKYGMKNSLCKPFYSKRTGRNFPNGDCNHFSFTGR